MRGFALAVIAVLAVGGLAGAIAASLLFPSRPKPRRRPPPAAPSGIVINTPPDQYLAHFSEVNRGLAPWRGAPGEHPPAGLEEESFAEESSVIEPPAAVGANGGPILPAAGGPPADFKSMLRRAQGSKPGVKGAEELLKRGLPGAAPGPGAVPGGAFQAPAAVPEVSSATAVSGAPARKPEAEPPPARQMEALRRNFGPGEGFQKLGVQKDLLYMLEKVGEKVHDRSMKTGAAPTLDVKESGEFIDDLSRQLGVTDPKKLEQIRRSAQPQ